MKKIKKWLSFLLAVVMCFSVVGVIPAKAATTLENHGINWYAGQNGNPWTGSKWTFQTGKDGEFEKMTNYIAAENSPTEINAPGWWADAAAETAYIGTWRQQATQEKWAVTAFDIEEEGNISGTSSQVLKINGEGSGDVIVVLKNADGFYPVWPETGEWTWKTVADTTGIEVNFTTGYKSGDSLYYVVKPSEDVEVTRITICPQVTFNGGTATNYPTVFTAFGGDRSAENDITNDQPSWFFGNSDTNPHTASHWAAMYGLNGNFFKMTAKEGETGNYIWHPEDVTDATYVRGYALNSTTDNWAVMGYAVSQTGTAISSPYGSTTVHANGGSAEFMVVLRNGSTGRFYPLYPTEGVWEWKALTGVHATPDVANGETIFSAPVEKGDIIYYVARPTGENTAGYVNICPQISLTDDKSVLNNYPTDDEFTGWENSANDDSLYPPYMSLDVSADKYQEENIRYGGLGRIVSVPKEDGGERLWATTNGGGLGEGVENFTLFYYSDDGGETWSDAAMVLDYDTILGRRSCRYQDHNLFYNDVTGDMWVTIGGSTGWYDGRWFTYVIKIHNPGSANIQSITWDDARLILDKHEIITGVPGSSPIRLSDGTIAMVLWNEDYEVAGFEGENKQWTAPHQIPKRYQKANLIVSTDNGETFQYMGGAAIGDVSGRLFDESSVYQKDMTNPNELIMVSRVRDGLAAFESHDKGVTWTQMDVNSNTFNFWADNEELKGTCSNFVIRRLQSGNLLMVYHDTTDGSQDRSRLTARISTDDGATWSGGLLLCETGSSYPSAIQTSDGIIHVVYDTGQREIHSRMYISSFTEADVLEGDSTTEHARELYCIMMGEPVYKKTRTMTHSSMYTQYASGMTAADAHSRGYEDMAEFWYKYGTNFEFTSVEGNGADSIHWNSSDGNNTVGSWYMTAKGTKDSAITWRSLNYSNVTYSSSFGEIYLSGGSGSADVMIVQKRGDNYYPLWPVKGQFQWQTITDTEKVALSDDGTLTTAVKPYDEIMVILRAGSAQITVNPVASYTTVEADATIVINHLEDSLFVSPSRLVGMTLSLDGKINFNFYVNSDNMLSEEAYVTFVLPKDGTQTVRKTDAVVTSNGLKFTCQVPAKEMADTIVATLYDGGEAMDTQSVSIRDYAEVIIENTSNLEEYTAATPLVKSMLHYGAYAQKLFNYNVEDLANKNYTADDTVQSVSQTELSGFSKERQGKDGLGVLAGATLVLESETTLRMFFQFEAEADLTDLKFTVDGIEQSYEISGIYYVVDIENIAACDLDKDFTVIVSAGSNSFEAACSAMTFCYNALINSSNVDLQNVAKALYLYNVNAKAYFE